MKIFSKAIIVGFGSGVVFAILIDNTLWFGMDALDPILPRGDSNKSRIW